MDISNPEAAARLLIDRLGQNGATDHAIVQTEERLRLSDAIGIAGWQAVFDRVQAIGQRKLWKLGIWG
jgi:hypothetical protein